MKEEKIQTYIDRLLEMGIFKIGDRQLYECRKGNQARAISCPITEEKRKSILHIKKSS